LTTATNPTGIGTHLTVAASWSGGKDSCLACYKAMEMGYQIGCLLNFTSKKHQRSCFHGIPRGLMDLQASLIGIPLLQHEVSDMEFYEREFRQAASALKGQGIESIVFGDIYLEEQENWVERVCGDLGITAIEPLWQRPPETILEEFIHSGFKAVVTSAKAELFDRHFVGREVDSALLRELKERGICPCGEHGEFHTLVVDGPLFRGGGIEITDSQAVLIEGFWPHWSLDIQGWQVNSRS
jgi:uncharacterized protein (TIGR00290 family)